MAAFEIRTPQAAPLAVTGSPVETLNLGEAEDCVAAGSALRLSRSAAVGCFSPRLLSPAEAQR